MDGQIPLAGQRLSRVLELLSERLDAKLLQPEFPDLTQEDVRGLFRALGEHLRSCQQWLDSMGTDQRRLETRAMGASLYCDGASRGNPGPSGAGVVLVDHNDDKVLQLSCFLDSATNNEAEYQALIKGLEAAGELDLRRLRIFSDSELVVKQLRGEYQVRNPRLQALYSETMSRLKQFEEYAIFHVGRELNQQADRLANDAIDRGLGGGEREKYTLAQRE